MNKAIPQVQSRLNFAPNSQYPKITFKIVKLIQYYQGSANGMIISERLNNQSIYV